MQLYFRLDWRARDEPLASASHLATTDDLGSRSYFIADEAPNRARLRIQRVKPADSGVFKCRVDFINSPTRNFNVNLTFVGKTAWWYLTTLISIDMNFSLNLNCDPAYQVPRSLTSAHA